MGLKLTSLKLTVHPRKEEGPGLDQGPQRGLPEGQLAHSTGAVTQNPAARNPGRWVSGRDVRGAFRRQTSTRLMKLEAEAAPGQRRVVVYSHNESSPDQEVRRAQVPG